MQLHIVDDRQVLGSLLASKQALDYLLNSTDDFTLMVAMQTPLSHLPHITS